MKSLRMTKDYFMIVSLFILLTNCGGGGGGNNNGGDDQIEVNQWDSSGPGGGGVNARAIDPLDQNIMYAGTGNSGTGAGALFKSINTGNDWIPVGIDVIKGNVRCIAIDSVTDTTIYVGNLNGLFKSIDGGTNWTMLLSGWTESVVIDNVNPEILYMATGNKISKSTDEGAHWSIINTGLPAGEFNAYPLIIDPITKTTLYVYVYIGGQDQGLYKSTDGGAHWNVINSSDIYLPNTLSVDPTTSTTLYAGMNTGVKKSTDGGAHWTSINNGLPQPNIKVKSIIPISSKTIYMAGTIPNNTNTDTNVLYVSNDGGSIWIAINTDVLNNVPALNYFTLDQLTP